MKNIYGSTKPTELISHYTDLLHTLNLELIDTKHKKT